MAREITMADNAHPKHSAWLSALSDFLQRCLAVAAVPTTVAQAGAGLTCAISADIQLDGGCNVGVTESAPDLQPFLGLSLRY